jgi:hypothetical protein
MLSHRSIVTGALVAGSALLSLVGCQGDTPANSETNGGGGTGWGTGTGGAATTSNSTSTANGGAGGASTTGTGTSTGTNTGSTTTGSACDGAAHTIEELTNGTVGPKVKVQVTDVVATSRKFLVSGSKKDGGTCLWGVYVSAPGLTTAKANSGLLALGYGTKASIPDGAAEATCPSLQNGPVGDLLPDDVKPGDVLTLVGETDAFILNSCGEKPGESTIAQKQLAKLCSVTRTGTAPVPAPAVLAAKDITKLGAQTDKAFYDQWSGVKVRLEGVTAIDQGEPGKPQTTDMYGNVVLDGSNVMIGDKLYYVKGSQNFCEKGPKFSSLAFDAIQGLVTLDYCTWKLQPTSKCKDFEPPSNGCDAEFCE